MSTLIQRSFAGGEISPSLYARVDTTKYASGLRTCRNMLVMRHGGAQNRPGSEFICEVSDSTKFVKLIKFVFNTDQTYVLEFGDEYMRVIKDGVQQTLAAQNITNITQANPAVLTYDGSDTYANGDEVFITGVVGMTQVNSRNFKVANVNAGANTFELQTMDSVNLNSTSYTAYASGGTVAEVYQIATPYGDDDLPFIKFVQSADVITLVHPDYEPRNLSRAGDTNWTLATITIAPSISAPTSPGATGGGAGTLTTKYVITAVDQDTYEESLPSSVVTVASHATLTISNAITLTWTGVSNALEYNVYKEVNASGSYGFVGIAKDATFKDIGLEADPSDNPTEARNPFNAAGDYPSTVSYVQQRRVFANTDNDTERIWLSRVANFNNFTYRSPIQDDDSLNFALAGRQVNAVKHLIDIGQLIVFTSGGEWSIQGNGAGIITPTEINPKQYSYNGSSDLPPLVIGGNALYVQARGSVVRDLSFDYTVEGYRGNDLTIFSSHLFDEFTLLDWDFQQIPHSIVWIVRNDGVLLGLTYVREHQMWAWHKHDFEDGVVENVCVVPDGNEDALYVVVKRTINGRTTRYIERLHTRQVSETAVEDSVFVDSSLSYDGTNTGSTTMTMSGGPDWTYDEELTLTASASFFASTDVGNQIHLTGSDGTEIRFTITAYTSATVVTGTAHKTVPVSMRSVAITSWGKAVDQLTGLWHLEGQQVSVFADSFVVANPNNDAYDVITVTNGSITLDKPYVVIHVGLPFISDIETLDIDTPQGETLADKAKLVSKVTIFVEKSRGIWAGPKPPTDDSVDPLENLYELKIRNNESYDDPVALRTGVVDVNIKSEWNSNGRVFIRQVDPVPLAVLAVAPTGLMPFRG